MFKFIVLLLLLNPTANAGSCVVLLYHHFSDTTPKSTSVSPKLFEQHLQYLQDNHFKVLHLAKDRHFLQYIDTQHQPLAPRTYQVNYYPLNAQAWFSI
jgi:hypothetical protein